MTKKKYLPDLQTSCEMGALRSRVEQLEAAIRLHRAQKADDRCWLDDLELYKALGDTPDNRVGDKAAMLANCQRFIERCCDGGGWPTYAELENQLAKWRKFAAYCRCCAMCGEHDPQDFETFTK